MTNTHLNTERQLLHEVAEGDTSAFSAIFRLHWDHVYSVALLASKSVDFAEDVAQEVFLWLWKEREKAPGIENLKAYLYGATRNFVLRKLKRSSVEENYRRSILTPPLLSQSDSSPESGMQYKELKKVLEKAVLQLPPQQQRAFRLSREQGMSHENIAQEMALSVNTVKDYIVKSLAFLRKYVALHHDTLLIYLLACRLEDFF